MYVDPGSVNPTSGGALFSVHAPLPTISPPFFPSPPPRARSASRFKAPVSPDRSQWDTSAAACPPKSVEDEYFPPPGVTVLELMVWQPTHQAPDGTSPAEGIVEFSNDERTPASELPLWVYEAHHPRVVLPSLRQTLDRAGSFQSVIHPSTPGLRHPPWAIALLRAYDAVWGGKLFWEEKMRWIHRAAVREGWATADGEFAPSIFDRVDALSIPLRRIAEALLSDAPLDVEAFSACLPALQRDAQVEFPDGNFVVAGPFVSSPQTPPPAAAVADAVDALISPPSAIIIAPWYDEGAGGWVVVQFMIAPAHCELHCPFQAAGTPGPDLLAAIHEANREIDLRLGRPVTEWVVARLFPPLHKDLKIASSGAIAYGILHTAVNKRGMHPEPPLDGWWRLKMLGDAALVRQRNGSPLHADRQGALDSVLATSPVSSDLQNATPVAPSRTDVSIPGALCPEAPSNAKASTIANPFSLIMSRKVKQSAVSTPHTTFSTAPASSKLPAPLKRPEMPALAAMVARNAATLAASIPPAQQTAPYDDLAAVEARLRAGVTRGVAAVGSLPSTGEKRAPPNVSRKRVRAGSDLGTPPPAKKRRAFLEPRGAAQQRALVLDAGAAWPCVSPVDLSGGQTDPGAQTANGRPNGGLTGLLNGVVAKMQLAEQKLLAKITKRGDDVGGKGGRVSEACALIGTALEELKIAQQAAGEGAASADLWATDLAGVGARGARPTASKAERELLAPELHSSQQLFKTRPTTPQWAITGGCGFDSGATPESPSPPETLRETSFDPLTLRMSASRAMWLTSRVPLKPHQKLRASSARASPAMPLTGPGISQLCYAPKTFFQHPCRFGNSSSDWLTINVSWMFLKKSPREDIQHDAGM
ncbi:uncharacterized protein BXZ73DRAFT_83156 [Epithele typhae]|uniref:uncharacterized protein n=1 Tax=Epithele typhae TaxID=378194 RepID=UPI002007425C|nr:uncharacterized protein BXZ73DRAFT_83156 [Epithele typhae]KAH9910834.1 hypothetical protein BXZ73DRAFT_83156 [Epithele typhae]